MAEHYLWCSNPNHSIYLYNYLFLTYAICIIKVLQVGYMCVVPGPFYVPVLVAYKALHVSYWHSQLLFYLLLLVLRKFNEVHVFFKGQNRLEKKRVIRKFISSSSVVCWLILSKSHAWLKATHNFLINFPNHIEKKILEKEVSQVRG